MPALRAGAAEHPPQVTDHQNTARHALCSACPEGADMTASLHDFSQPAAELPRDHYGRPLIDTGDGGQLVPYTRASTMAKALDDGQGLMMWHGRMTALGLARRADLLALAGTLSDRAPDKAALNKLVKDAMEAGGGTGRRNLGTALHSFTEQLHTGTLDREAVPVELRGDLNAYHHALKDAGLRVVACERFVVLDEWRVAGSFDRLLEDADGRMYVGDLKTGAGAADYAQSTALQIGIYARGQLYDHQTGVRTPLPGATSLTVGVLIHMEPGSGLCKLHRLDLSGTDRALGLATEVRDFRRAKVAQAWS
jgi:hypothetical protein